MAKQAIIVPLTPQQEAQQLRIRLSRENTAKVRKLAVRGNTTPPRVVNQIVSRYKCNGK